MSSDNVIIQDSSEITVIITDSESPGKTIIVPAEETSISVAPSNNQLEDTIIVSRGMQGPAGSSGSSGDRKSVV